MELKESVLAKTWGLDLQEDWSDLKEGLLIFKGTCHDELGSVLIDAQFSIFISPREKDSEVT